MIFNNNGDVKVGYITENSTFHITQDLDYLHGQERFGDVHYNPETDSYEKDGTENDRIFLINKPVPYFDSLKTYLGTLKKGDKVKVTYANASNGGDTYPWLLRTSGISKNNKSFTEGIYYVSIGLEYGCNGKERAWY